MTTKQQSNIWVLFDGSDKPKDTNWYAHGKINLRFVYLDSKDNKPRNFTDSRYDEQPDAGGLKLDGLRIQCQYSADKPEWGAYGWTIDYRSQYSTNLESARLMVKTLETIVKRMAKVAAEYGEPATFAQFALRACRALGVQGVLRETKESKASSSYLEQEFNQMPLTDLDFMVTTAIAKGLEPFMQKA